VKEEGVSATAVSPCSYVRSSELLHSWEGSYGMPPSCVVARRFACARRWGRGTGAVSRQRKAGGAKGSGGSSTSGSTSRSLRLVRGWSDTCGSSG
jgi:hypothetical protein